MKRNWPDNTGKETENSMTGTDREKQTKKVYMSLFYFR